MKLNTLKALSFPILIVVCGLLQSAVAHDRRRVNEIRELDYEFEDIDARFLDPLDQFLTELAVRGLLDEYAEELVARHKCKCGATFATGGDVRSPFPLHSIILA
ncbi:hypothetical protein MD484_g3690, partial [Candolleomyces efflorescens]